MERSDFDYGANWLLVGAKWLGGGEKWPWDKVTGYLIGLWTVANYTLHKVWNISQFFCFWVGRYNKKPYVNEWPHGKQWVLFSLDPQCSLASTWAQEILRVLTVSCGAIHLKVLTQFSQIETRLIQNLPHRSYLSDVILLQASVSVM